MSSRQLLSDESIARLLLEEEENNSPSENLSDSETEDNVEVDDVESDYQPVRSDSSSSSDEDIQVPLSQAEEDNGLVQNTPSIPSQQSSCILTFSQSSVRSRARHVWATTKGRTSGRTAAINIVHVARGPARELKAIVDPLELFEHFMTAGCLKKS